MKIATSIQERNGIAGVLTWTAQPDGTWHGAETLDELPVAQSLAQARVVTAADFRDRFTPVELAAISELAYSGVGDVNAQLLLFKVATNRDGIDLASKTVSDGLNHLVAKGKLSADRAAAILG